MRITAVTIDDYKRVRHVAITPEADSHIVLIGGRNRQGKSSTLDALDAALGGADAIAADPIRHGAEVATIRIELGGNDGTLVVERTIALGGKPQLVVRDAEGMPKRRPQELLDRLIGARFLDPMAFMRLKASDQRAALMRVIPGAAEIERLDERRDDTFRRRTETGRHLTSARGELERLPAPPAEPLSAMDVAALAAEHATFAHQQRAGDGLGHEAKRLAAAQQSCERAAQDASQRVARMESELDAARRELQAVSAALTASETASAVAQSRLADAAAAWKASEPRRIEIERQLANAGEHNRRVGEQDAARQRRAEVETAVKRFTGEVDKLTTTIESIDQRKVEILSAAALPVDGLEIADDGIRIAGVPFAQAAASEQIRIALALAIAGSPGLDDVWVRDGALLDDESLDLVAKHAEASGKRVWIERVSDRDPGVIVIHDGMVVK